MRGGGKMWVRVSSRSVAVPAVITTLLIAAALYALAYPALFPPALEDPAVSIDPTENKAHLDAVLTLEVRGSFDEAEVREQLAITPPIDFDKVEIAIEHIARNPLHGGLPWAKTRVTLIPYGEKLWAPETRYDVALRDEEFAFDTITLPRVVSVVADEGDIPFQSLPTHRGVLIRFNEAVDWDDKFLSVVPAAAVEITPEPGGNQNTVLLRPVERWENFESYTVTVRKGLPDEDGHLAEEDYEFQFTTWPAPKITRAVPEGPGFGPDAVIEVDFERPADRASVEAGFAIDPPLNGSFEWLSDTQLRWRPESLPYSGAWNVSVGGLAAGGDLFESRSFSFETHDPPVFVEIRGDGNSPSIIEAVPSGGLGAYSLSWNTGDSGARILAASPYGETKRYEVTVTSGDQTAVAGIDLQGHPWPNFTPQPCPAGWYMLEISVCTDTDELAGPVKTYIARIDIRDPSLVFDALSTSNYVGGTAPVSARGASAGSIIAVNGDLFHGQDGGTFTVGPLISSGGYAYNAHYEGAYFALDAAQNASVGVGIDVRPTVWGPNGWYTVHAVNAAPRDGEIALFNGYRSSPVSPFEGCQVTVSVAGGDMADDAYDISCGTISNVPVIAGGYTLVGRGAGADWLRGNIPGVLTLQTPGYSMVIGGSHVLQPYVAAGNGYHVEGRHPRTAIGTDGGGYLYMVVVDGRSAASVGMTIAELSSYLGGLGVTRAINLDGGGSSAFVQYGQVLNAPSDGKERSVASILSISRSGQRGCSHPLIRC